MFKLEYDKISNSLFSVALNGEARVWDLNNEVCEKVLETGLKFAGHLGKGEGDIVVLEELSIILGVGSGDNNIRIIPF